MNSNLRALALGCLAFLVSLNGLARTNILIAAPNASENDFELVLSHNKDLISFIDITEADSGTISGDITQSQPPLNKELVAGFLSPIRRERLIDSLKVSPDIPSELRELQLHLFTRPGAIISGSLEHPLELKRSDDRVYINGFRLNAEDLKRIRLHPKLFYHLSYLSNAYKPLHFWGKGEDFPSLALQALASGTCQQPISTDLKIDAPILTLYPGHCIIDQKTQVPDSVDLSTNLNFESRPTTPSPFWTKNRLLLATGATLLTALLVSETKKNYDVSIEWPF